VWEWICPVEAECAISGALGQHPYLTTMLKEERVGKMEWFFKSGTGWARGAIGTDLDI
jgi:hypothetical protein